MLVTFTLISYICRYSLKTNMYSREKWD